MNYSTIGDINTFHNRTIKPFENPEELFEVYSVPSFDSGMPELLCGKEIASSKSLVLPNDVLLCKINPRINRVWVVGEKKEKTMIASSEWIVVRTSEYYSDYLAWYFRSEKFKRLMTSEVTGIGGSLTRAQPKRVATYPVPVIEKEDQRSIACMLNKLQDIILNYKSQLALLDDLIKSRFVEMFGTVFHNKYNYDIVTIQDVCAQIKDGTHQTPEYTNDSDNGVWFMSSKDVTSGKIDWNHLKLIPQYLHEELYARVAPQKGDLLLAKNGTTGVAAIVDREAIFDIYVSLALLRPIGINSTYLWAAVNSQETKAQFDASLKGIGVPNLHLKEIKKAKIIRPPSEKQEVFCEFVSQVDKSKSVIQKSLDEAQLLFDSLMQEYFG